MTIDEIRAASRRLVRELGFMGGPFAGTNLPPSAVHALIEIDAREGISARALGGLLRLDKSSVSRMLRKLAMSGDIEETPDEADGRSKKLSLSAAGRARVAEIHAFARMQVASALERLPAARQETILDGLSLYADALGAATTTPRPVPAIEILARYRPGLIARITEMHALYYARTAGFGRRFESVVAGDLAAFCDQLDRPGNGIWAAVQHDRIVGSVAIQRGAEEDVAHLRWFIVDDAVRGGGVGRRLLAAALGFADTHDFAETHLWTFGGLDAARHLYEQHGFALAEAHPGSRWGREVLEQRFVRKRA